MSPCRYRERQFEFTDDRNALAPRRLQRGDVERHAGADDDLIRLEKAVDGVLSRFPWNPERIELCGRRGLSGIGHKHRFAAALEKPCRRHSASCHTTTTTIHLNFNVDRLNNAKINAAIQNRMITFDSFHPISSKWW